VERRSTDRTFAVGLRAALPLVLVLISAPARAQPVAAAQPATDDRELVEVVPSSEEVTLEYTNRPITVLRARVLSHMPEDRAKAATIVLDRIVAAGTPGEVTTRAAAGVRTIRVGNRDVLTLVPADADELTGQTLEQQVEDATAALRVALAEAVELKTPGRMLRSGLAFLGLTALFVGGVVVVSRLRRRVRRAVMGWTARRITRLMPGGTREPVHMVCNFASALVTSLAAALIALMVYGWLSFSLRQFPYTRPWGESLRSLLMGMLGRIGVDVVDALPGLGVVLVVVLVTRLLVRISNAFFKGVERSRAETWWAHPETAGATRRLVAILLWLFALVVSYPYLPGSGSEAFRGASVFLGLVVSLGSSGVVSQLMSGLTLTYSRALSVGDFVKIGDTEGDVTAMNLLSVKLRTFQGEQVTVPNAVVVALSTTNYTKLAAAGGASLAANVTIGYDTPWRQVRELLLLAAARTEGVRREPPPQVVKDALEDFYVRYRLLVSLVDPAARDLTRDRLHASILDLFNQYGVQIMSPNYEADTARPKVVPPAQWYEPPARPDPERDPDLPAGR
jgi:small-conductance mechanosensitive channel